MRADNLRNNKVLKGAYYILVFSLAFSFSNIAYAVPPTSPYSPGATLDPACLPGGTNCTVSSASGSAGEIQFANASSTFASDTDFVWDNTNKRFGLGTTTPSYRLDVVGFINTDQYSGYKQAGDTILYASSTNFSLLSGIGAGSSLLYDGSSNTALGYQSLYTATSSDYNTAVGYRSLYSNTTGYQNTANGYQSLYSNTTGGSNTALGYQSLYTSTSTSNQTAVGYQSLYSNTTGTSNTANGYQSLYSNTTGGSNTAFGYQSLYTSTSTGNNTAVGYQALYANTTGSWNSANGASALRSNTTGSWNAANGALSLYSNTTGYGNTTNGYQALYANTTGFQNVTNGVQALRYNTTGNQNTASGYNALYNNITGSLNTAFGYQSLYTSTSTSSNTAVGYRSLYSNTTGTSNTANGYRSLYSNTTGYTNLANGYQSLYSNTTGYSNTANGAYAINYNTTGFNNTAYGYRAGIGDGSTVDQRSVVDTEMTFIGFGSSRDESVASTTPLSNGTAIGKNARVGASNSLVLGGTGGDAVNVGIGTTTPSQTLHVEQTAVGVVARFVNGTGYCDINPTTTALVCTSDATLKKDVAKIDGGLSSITALRGVNFRWLSENENSQKHIGFIAQEVEKVLPELVATDTASGKKSVNYIGFTPVLIEAVKELALKVYSLEERVSQIVASGVSSSLANIKDFVVETLTAKKVATDTLEMKDSVTNEVYCVRISNGEWDKSKGVCGGAPASTQMASVVTAEEPVVEPAPNAEAPAVSESETTGAVAVDESPVITPSEIITEKTDTADQAVSQADTTTETISENATAEIEPIATEVTE